MDSKDILQKAWGFTSNPFFPENCSDGNGPLFPGEHFLMTLNPLKDKRIIKYYHDLYDWKDCNLIGKICNEAILQIFPEKYDLSQQEPLNILISGYRQTGRKSLMNLIICKILSKYKIKPIVVNSSITSSDSEANIFEIARRFIQICSRIEKLSTKKQKELKDLYNWEKENNSSGINLFNQINDYYNEMNRRPVVIVLDGGDDYDIWEAIYDGTKPLCDYIIVITSKDNYAKTCFDSMRSKGKNTVLISAPKLNFEETLSYLQSRLIAEKKPDLTDDELKSLNPFSNSSIRILFENGKTANMNDVVSHPIGYLKKTFHRILNDQINDIIKIAEHENYKTMDQFDSNDLKISTEKVRNIRLTMNMGQ